MPIRKIRFNKMAQQTPTTRPEPRMGLRASGTAAVKAGTMKTAAPATRPRPTVARRRALSSRARTSSAPETIR